MLVPLPRKGFWPDVEAAVADLLLYISSVDVAEKLRGVIRFEPVGEMADRASVVFEPRDTEYELMKQQSLIERQLQQLSLPDVSSPKYLEALEELYQDANCITSYAEELLSADNLSVDAGGEKVSVVEAAREQEGAIYLITLAVFRQAGGSRPSDLFTGRERCHIIDFLKHLSLVL